MQSLRRAPGPGLRGTERSPVWPACAREEGGWAGVGEAVGRERTDLGYVLEVMGILRLGLGVP